MDKNILIVSFYFPPSTLVAGRRWAKLSKYLSLSGYKISVIAAKSETNIGLWDDDVLAFRNHITYISPKARPKFYCKRKIEGPLNVIEKIRFKMSYYSFMIWDLLWRAFTKGHFFDPSIGNYRSLKSAILSVHEKRKIDAIIVSGGPFRWCYYVSRIANNYLGNMPLIVDIRDFWANGGSLERLSPEKVSQEKYFEAYTFSRATVILTVNELIADYIAKSYPKLSSKVNVVPHAFDGEDFKNLSVREIENNSRSISLVYAGSLYAQMDYAIALLKELLIMLKKRGYKTAVYFFTPALDYPQLYENDIRDFVIYKPLLKPKELFTTISRIADIVLQPRASVMLEENFKSSKFYEQIASRKPVLYLGVSSELSIFYQTNKLGYALTSASDVETIADEIISNLSSKIIPDKKFDLSPYTFEKQVGEISKIIESLISVNQKATF